MRGFRVGYILSISFLLVLALVFITMGFFPAPIGPKSPEYPTFTNTAPLTQSVQNVQRAVAAQAEILLPTGTPDDSFAAPIVTPAPYDSLYYPEVDNGYQEKLDQYDKDQEKYVKDQEAFMKHEMVPYVSNIFVFGIVILVLLQVIGILLAKRGMELAGGALTFTGVWGVILGPIWGMMFFASSMMSGLVGRATQPQPYSFEPIIQAVGIACLAGSIIALIVGVSYDNGFNFLRRPSAPKPQA